MTAVDNAVASKGLLEMWRATRVPIRCVFVSPDGKGRMSLDGVVDQLTPECLRLKGNGWGEATLYHEEVLFPDDSRFDWSILGLRDRPPGTSIVAVLPDGALFGMFEITKAAIH